MLQIIRDCFLKNPIAPVMLWIIAIFLSTSSYAKKPIVIGSKIDTESILLCQMIHLVLQNNKIPVTDKCGTGVTQVVRKALLAGEIDLYPEYTGNAQYVIQDFKLTSTNPALLFQSIAEQDLAKNNIVWLKPAPANNTFVIAVTQKFSKLNQIRSVADLAQYIQANKPLKLIASYEFVTRADGLKAFEAKYHFKLKPNQLIMLPGGNTAQTETALARGTNNINAAMAYGTDGQLEALGLIGLTDLGGAQQAYHPAVTVRAQILKDYPQLKTQIEPMFAGLETRVLSKLNGQVVVGGQNPIQVAQQYLKQQGIIQ